MTVNPGSIATVTPTFLQRQKMMQRAVRSIVDQAHQPQEILVGDDVDSVGPSVVRNRLTQAATSEYVAYLDDDDVMRSEHLAVLYAAAMDTGADLVYPWFDIVGAQLEPHTSAKDPLFINGKPAFGHPFDDEAKDWLLTNGNFIPVTVLVKRELVLDVGGWPIVGSEDWPHDCCEDWALWQRIVKAGGKVHHVAQRTWLWCWSGWNTSGKPSRRELGVPGVNRPQRQGDRHRQRLQAIQAGEQ